MAKKTIKDFGEKIGGARKDLWAGRHMTVVDLESLSEEEKKRYVKRDEIWPREKLEDLHKYGVPKNVLFWRDEMRKSVHKAPKVRVNEIPNFESYVKICSSLRDDVQRCTTMDDIRDFYETAVTEYMVKSNGRFWSYRNTGVEKVINGNKILKYCNLSSIDKELSKRFFLETAEEHLRTELTIMHFNREEHGIIETGGVTRLCVKSPSTLMIS